MNNCNVIVNMSETKNFWLVEMLPFTLEDRRNDKFVKEYQNLIFNNKILGIGWSDYPELKEIFGQIKTENGSLTDTKYQIIKNNIKKCQNLKDLTVKDKNIQNIYQKVWQELYKKDNKEEEKKNRKDNEDGKKIEKNGGDKENAGLKLAIKNFFLIQEGDVVLSRLRNGKYIVGRVENNKKYYGTNEEEEKEKIENDLLNKWRQKENENEKIKSKGFGWRCKVKQWYMISRKDVPSDIIGRCSQRNSSTLTRICDDRIKLFILKLLEKEEKKKSSCPPITLNNNNFARALNADELEDLVYLYIMKRESENKNKEENNLLLLPSQCKISEPMYEFYLQDKNGKYITCQVKNRAVVEFSKYKEEIDNDKKKLFKKIYLYSGIENYGDDKEKDKYKEKIEIIKKEELWNFLQLKKQYFNGLQDNYYYKIDDKKEDKEINICEIEENGWTLHRYRNHWNYKEGKVRQNKFKVYYYDDTGLIINTSSKENCNKILRSRIKRVDFNYNCNNIDKPNFYYNNEFKCFIIENAKEDEKNEIESLIEEVKPIIRKLVEE